MSMIVEENNNRIKVVIPNSEATVSAQLDCIKDSEVTGFYTSDNEDFKNKIVSFLNKNFDYILDVKATLEVINGIKDNYYNDFKEIYKDKFNNLDKSFEYFSKINSNYIKISKMYYSGQNNRYFKFKNDDLAIKRLREILYGDITGFYIINNEKYYIVKPYLLDNISDILIKRKTKILALKNDDFNNDKVQYWTYSPGENGNQWNYCFNNNKMVIGQDLIGDLRKLENRENISNKIKSEYLKENPYNDIYCVDDFYNKLKKGDIVIAKIGISKLLGYGEVIDNEYVFDDNRVEYKHVRNVKWLKKGIWELPPKLKVAQKTLTNITTYGEFPGKLLSVINNEKLPEINSDNKYKSEWIVPANQNIYDHISSFEKNRIIDWKLNNNFNVGDIIYFYATRPIQKLNFVGVVEKINLSKNDIIDDSEFWLNEEEPKYNDSDKFVRIRKVRDLNYNMLGLNQLLQNGLSSAPQGAIRVNKQLSEYINSIINSNDLKYTKEDFLNEVFIDESKYNTIISLLERKKNIILEGAPGVGKTFMAKRLAYSLIGSKDNSRIKLIQFHQSYSYEDFIKGYRPTKDGFKLQDGIFYKICKEAEKDLENPYYIIIDEINRGNLSKIFGELLMLIEADKRGDKLTLAYSDNGIEEQFSVPENLYIIGLMNTADRSLALIDYALRRRFSFIRIEPAFESEKFMKQFRELFDNRFISLIELIKNLNETIEKDESLGEGFKIGHSYFCPNIEGRVGNNDDIKEIIDYEIIPLLEEYWYDDKESLVQWTNNLNGIISND